MGSNRVVLLTSLRSSAPNQLLSYKQIAAIGRLFVAFTSHPQTIEKTATSTHFLAPLRHPSPLSPVFATLTKTWGWGQGALPIPGLLPLPTNALRGVAPCIASFFCPNFQHSTFDFQPLSRNAVSLLLYFAASLSPPSTPNVRTSQGMMTCRKMTGSGQTFTWRPRWPPWGLIQASFGTSPLLRSR